MPRLIDHTEREIAVAEAAWRVAAREGVRAVSVRGVAAEAGLATASLRRAFPTQASLLAYCLDLARRRAAGRIAALAQVTDPGSALAVLVELLPLDAERRLEAEVQFALGTAALTDPALRPAADAAHEDVATACRHVARALTGGPAATDPTQPDATDPATAHLHALLDGLALHLVRQAPAAPTGWAVEVLRGHLATLAAGPADRPPG
ncbi:TetR/AcrR family transcriptional regulator [Kineococcus radiotolerans]|uniref:Transcriptional regulator, TetR family n=1 Tax=Kineococcus radiotolerans (strain ATCC BAA-149 / DSM 14245 / SRS30216) TaxID=266940 RepID=A6WG38_KINRD|nr:TetR/AcrR family transcriptional regulator [Kineococcus radiotolerans]ABS05777.1 transcriptional regulator, TetR family [Kineococcus radiotolerans SRS30216 = ATCC BAA-149]